MIRIILIFLISKCSLSFGQYFVYEELNIDSVQQIRYSKMLSKIYKSINEGKIIVYKDFYLKDTLTIEQLNCRTSYPSGVSCYDSISGFSFLINNNCYNILYGKACIDSVEFYLGKVNYLTRNITYNELSLIGIRSFTTGDSTDNKIISITFYFPADSPKNITGDDLAIFSMTFESSKKFKFLDKLLKGQKEIIRKTLIDERILFSFDKTTNDYILCDERYQNLIIYNKYKFYTR